MRDAVSGVQTIILVVDCADHERMDKARDELHNNVLNVAVEGTEKRALLVFANKQDLPNALSSAELTEKLGMHELKVTRWHVQPSCGTSGVGLFEGLHWLAQNNFDHRSHTVSFNIETVRHQNTDFTLRDFGGHPKIRPLWKCWSNWGAQALIFVVDCTDRERIDEARDELHNNIFNEHWPVVANIERCPLLVFANKQDLPNALSSAEMVDKLGMHEVKNRWHVQPSCATTGEGLLEGLHWLSQNVEKHYWHRWC
ncbi:Arf-domain-containing protein [Peniophora sp. CONT]|nr:Arf-domain-containing protein [Peniophora sp. CONT]